MNRLEFFVWEFEGKLQSRCNFGADKSNVQLWQKHMVANSGCEVSQRKFTGPKGKFLEIDDAVFTFFSRETGLFVSYVLLRKEAIKKARYLNIPRSRFKASKGWATRFMR
jgi:hypothetical protein